MTIETEPTLLKYRRTKIVATLGPASSEERVIEQLIQAGVDVFRFNMSHGDHESHRLVYERVQRCSARKGRRLTAVLFDLSGPKIRVGTFPNGRIPLIQGREVTVTTREVAGEEALIPSQYAALANDVSSGDRILLDDGALELEVVSVDGTEVRCKVTRGGILKNHKGMNLPGVDLSAPSLTDKDKRDAELALELGADFLALSFVRRASDVDDLRELVDESGKRVQIVSKIERPEALDDIDAIIERSDAIMVARGDLGVELPPQTVPLVQSQLIDLARSRAKPVIVATQMLESMMYQSRPTRAEVSDVAYAVRSGADAVMLSGESAAGKYPVAAVAMMDTIARQTEAYLWHQAAFGGLTAGTTAMSATVPPIAVEDALGRSTAQLSRDLRVRTILVISQSGRTAAVMSSFRPAAPIVTASSDPSTCRMASLLWGVIPAVVETTALHDSRGLARRLARELDFGSEGQKLLVVRGFGSDPNRDTPSITVVTI
jgi:pyruvate kinase